MFELINEIVLFPISHPGYFGKVGMRNYHVRKTSLNHHMPTINVENLWSLVGDKMREHYKNDKEGKAPVINLNKHVSCICH